MRKIYFAISIILVVVMLSTCSFSARFPRVPDNIDKNNVPKQIIDVKARRFSFEPKEIRVQQGKLVILQITSQDVDHGFKLPDFGINESIPEKAKVEIEFYAIERGEYSFLCSKFCGIGHPLMLGKLIIE
jgi:heme/copper-type cytochrome/quinol oxidase subunit 2